MKNIIEIIKISIHRSLAGPDPSSSHHSGILSPFQSTGPLRDPTIALEGSPAYRTISIHRSLAGPDEACFLADFPIIDFNPQVPCGTRPTIASYQSVLISYFNPQVPCGTRLYERIRYTPLKTFQSTGPLRDPTLRHLVAEHLSGISIHRSLAGPDRRDWMTRRGLCHFNPQVPCGTRLFLWAIVCTAVLFQSTGPLRDPTDLVLTINIIWIHFNPQVPCGTRLRPVLLVISSINFNPQVPCGTRHSKRIIFSNAENFNPQVPCGTRQTEAG